MKNYTGKEYMQIEIANNFGLDKILFEERIQWVNDNEKELENKLNEADAYYEYGASVQAYRKAQNGTPVGYMVGLDACASGLQILSVLTGCRTGCINSGVIGSTRKDPYTYCTSIINELLNTNNTWERKDVKAALMTVFYGSEAEPKKVFGDDTPELQAFYKAAYQIAPGAMKLLSKLKTLWDNSALEYNWIVPDGFHVKCKVKDYKEKRIEVDTLPNHPTFKYRYKVNTPIEQGRFLAANIAHSVDGYIFRELSTRCNYDSIKLRIARSSIIRRLKSKRKEQTIYNSPFEQAWKWTGNMSIIGAEEIYNTSANKFSKAYCKKLLTLINKTLNRPSFEVIGIHDKFKCLANYMNYVRLTYIELLSEIANSDILNFILECIGNTDAPFSKLDKNIHKDILKAEYPLS